MSPTLPLHDLLKGFNLSTTDIASPQWWTLLSERDAPLFKQQNGQCLVLFVWRDPQGGSQLSTTSAVLLNVSGLTNHNTWQPTCLIRFNNSDLWFATLTISTRWRGSYAYIPIQSEQLPELVKQNDDSRESQRRWWLEVVKQQVIDPLNHNLPIVSGWGKCSALHLPQAPQEAGWQEWDKGELNKIADKHCKQLNWNSATLNNQRQCTVFSTAEGKAPLVILLDGQNWGAVTGTLSVLKQLTAQKKITAAHYLLIPSINNITRGKELSCDHIFWQSIIKELLPKVTTLLVQTNKTMTDCVVIGQSLGGLSAVYAVTHFPAYFNKAISLSGSFWWPEIQRMQNPDAFELTEQHNKVSLPKNSLADRVSKDELSVSGLSIYQTVGKVEKQLSIYNDLQYDIFKEHGAQVTYHKVDGGHDWLSWRSSMINGLMALMPG